MEGQHSKIYLGLDFSTQQLKIVAINEELKIIFENAVKFDEDLPEFGTAGGAHINEDKVTVTAPTLMWVKALDLLLDKMKNLGFQFENVVAVSGSGQQHGSVYWKKNAIKRLQNLDSSKPLHEQLKDSFSVVNSPIWMDSSTTKQCQQLEEKVGGADKLAAISGSRAYERFTGLQIAKIYQTRESDYNNTERISLVSSFAASLFLGDYAAIDDSDGSGMNLLDIRTRKWSPECLEACAKDLKEKLDSVVPAHTVLGPVCKYYTEKYNFSSSCQVIAFTGDNPATLAAFAPPEGDVIFSLGTSDNLLLSLRNPKVALEGSVFANPMDTDIFMAILCFKNGSLTRQNIRDQCAEQCWDTFSNHLKSTKMGNNGNIGIYFDVREIQPLAVGTFRFNEKDEQVSSFPHDVEVRALVEGQFMARRVHAETLGFNIGSKTKVIATGGASLNTGILQVIADVFNAPIFVTTVPNSAALGAAYRAKHGFLHELNREITFSDVIKDKEQPVCVAKPTPGSEEVYGPMCVRYKKLEESIAKQQGDLHVK